MTSKGTRLAFVAAALGVMLLYFGWQTESFVEAEDSIVFTANILAADPRLNPHHLFFEPLYALAVALLPGVAPMLVMQSLTAAFGVLALGCVFGLVAARRGGLAGLISALLVAQLYAFWHYSKVVDAYVPALSLALLGLVILEYRERLPNRAVAPLAALALTGSVLLHQLYTFLAAVVALAFLFDRRGSHPVRDASLYSALGLALVSGSYLGAYLASDVGQPFAFWLLGYANGGLWDAPGLSTPFLAILGIGSVFVTTPPLFASETLAALFDRQLAGRSLIEEVYLAERAFAGPVAEVAAIAGFALLIGGYLGLLVLGLRGRSREPLSCLGWVLVAAIGVYACLILLWEAANREFWIHVVVFAIVLFGLRASWSRAMRGVAVLVIGVGAVLNFAGGIGPLSDDRNDYWAAVMAHVSEAVPPGALVISECSWLCRQYAERAGPEHVYPSAGPEGRVMAEIAAGRNTGKVYLTEWAIAPPNLFLPAGEGRRAAFLSEIEEMLGPLPGAAATPMRAPAVWLWDGGWRMVAPGRDLAPGR